jgi:hypothetical protein
LLRDVQVRCDAVCFGGGAPRHANRLTDTRYTTCLLSGNVRSTLEYGSLEIEAFGSHATMGEASRFARPTRYLRLQRLCQDGDNIHVSRKFPSPP